MRIIVIDDQQNQRHLLGGYLKKQKHMVREASSGLIALELLKREGAEVAITDMRMPEMDGLTLLKKIKKIYPDMEVVVITAYGSIEDAVEAMKAGATDYLIKPVKLEQLDIILKKVEKSHRLVAENRYLRRKLETVESFPEFIGQSPVFKKMLSDISVIAKTDSTVFIKGESGTGKELVARAIHSSSNRRDKPFLAVNCAALPEPLLESELFGHEKGAFTGAVRRRIGRFELAHKGTIFLDEIGDISLPMQIKLLRVLETKSFERLGGSENIKVDIRLVTATNRDIESKVKDGSFREDLYYRLNVIPINLPPLRERKEDILPLVNYFIDKFSNKVGKKIEGITPQAKDLLLSHRWPGNVRELENTIERAVVLTRTGAIDSESLEAFKVSSGGSAILSENLNLTTLEKKAIIEALQRTKGQLIKAAELLGIHRNTLRLKMKQYGINKSL